MNYLAFILPRKTDFNENRSLLIRLILEATFGDDLSTLTGLLPKNL